MSLLDESIQLPNFSDFLSVPTLAGAGVGVFAAFSVFRSPSIAQMLGLGLLGGLGGFYVYSGTSGGAPAPKLPGLPGLSGNQPSLPTFDLGSLLQSPLDALQPSGGSPMVNLPPVTLMSPETAYTLVQQGKYHTNVKNAKMSRYYNWSDLMVSDSIGDSNRKTIPLAKYQLAAKLGAALDKLVQATGGKKITVNSWVRIQTKSSNHTTGGAADLGGALSYGYIKNTLLPAARRIGDFKGVGYPTKVTHRSLHLDILANHGDCGANHQFVFVDNGDGHYPGSCQPVNAPAPAPAPKPVKHAPAPAPPKTSIMPKPGSINIAPPPAPRALPFIPFPVFLPSLPTSQPGPVYGPGDVSGSIVYPSGNI